jgi:molybdenum cofactor synthesis domain-containing protein
VREENGQAVRTAAIVVIGDEILSGKTADTNTPFLLRELRELGVAVERVLVVPDTEAAIVEAVRATQSRFDYIFTSGGVGPTHDDVTLPAIAKAMDRSLVRHPALVRMIEDWYTGSQVREVVLRMADVPEGTELVYGAGLRFPVLVLENIYILPGIPEIFREKFLAMKERFRSTPFHVRRFYCRRGEGHLAPFMTQIVSDFPGIAVGSYPTLTEADYRVQVIFESKDLGTLERAASAFRERVGEEVIFKSE